MMSYLVAEHMASLFSTVGGRGGVAGVSPATEAPTGRSGQQLTSGLKSANMPAGFSAQTQAWVR